MKFSIAAVLALAGLLAAATPAQPSWQTELDSQVRFYQPTDFGVVLTGTDRSLYAIDGRTGQRIWRRSTGRIQETAVVPVPDTDMILLSRDEGSKSRLEAVDLLSGAEIWSSEKVKGDVLQLAVDPASDLIAVVLVKNPEGRFGDRVKKKPIICVLQLSTGAELWKRELDSDIELMPSRFGDDLGEVSFTLDNYRPPLLLDGRLFLFYEGATSYDARTGAEKEREKFRVNEDGLALTEGDPIFDDSRIFISGRGRIRALDRRTGSLVWKAEDVGNVSEMAMIARTLVVRTGGQFTRLKDGEMVSKGPFGVAAIDTATGKSLWRYKGADKGLTNFAFVDAGRIVIADKDDLIAIDIRNGKQIDKFRHGIERAQFVIINEAGHAVIGGRDEIAAFEIGSARIGKAVPMAFAERTSFPAREIWRTRHKPPGRGALRIISGIALRATALYFRYGGLATSVFNLARGGLSIASTVNSFRWSGLRSRFGSFDLTTLASNAARNYVTRRIYAYGTLARTPAILNRLNGLQVTIPNLSDVRGRAIGTVVGRVTPNRRDVQESILDRLDPVRQAERLSDYLLRRKRLAELRGNYMYFYTELPKPFDKKGLAGVNIHTGRDERVILASDPDPRFVTDETVDLLYSADGRKLQAFRIQPL